MPDRPTKPVEQVLRGIFVGHPNEHPLRAYNGYQFQNIIKVYNGTLWGIPKPRLIADIPVYSNIRYENDSLNYPEAITYEFGIMDILVLLIAYLDTMEFGELKPMEHSWFKNVRKEAVGRVIYDYEMVQVDSFNQMIVQKYQTSWAFHSIRLRFQPEIKYVGKLFDAPIWCVSLKPFTKFDKAPNPIPTAITIIESAEFTLLSLLEEKIIERDEEEDRQLKKEISRLMVFSERDDSDLWELMEEVTRLEELADEYDFDDGMIEE